MTHEHRNHLALLADALEKRDPALFDTCNFVVKRPHGIVRDVIGTATTVPGIPKRKPGESWFNYGERVLGIGYSRIEWDFLFDDIWGDGHPDQNTPTAAARRIRHFLETGEAPSCWEWIEREKKG